MIRPSHLKEIVWLRSTDSIEIACGGVLLLLRSAWMLVPIWSSIPTDVQGYLIPANIPERIWGAVLFAMSVTQIVIALSRWWQARALLSTLIALTLTSASIGYYRAGYFYRSAVPLLLGLVILEIWIAWRALHDHYTKSTPDRRTP